MKKLLIILFSFFALFLGGCLKDTPNVDFSNIQAHAEFEYPNGAGGNGLGSGLEFFAGGTMILDNNESDTLFFMVNIAAPNPLNTPTNVTIGVDPTKITAYNADTNNAVKYEQLPDSCFKLISTTGTVPAGKYLDTFYLVFFPGKIDPTRNYMAPVVIQDAGSVGISQNFGTIWFHTIGNPIAGLYTWQFERWPSQTPVGPPDGTSFTDVQLLLPVDPTTVTMQSGYYIGPHYLLSFDNNGGTLSNFSVTMNAADVATMAGAGVTIKDGPNIITADPVAGVYKLQYLAYNGSAYRYVIDTYSK